AVSVLIVLGLAHQLLTVQLRGQRGGLGGVSHPQLPQAAAAPVPRASVSRTALHLDAKSLDTQTLSDGASPQRSSAWRPWSTCCPSRATATGLLSTGSSWANIGSLSRQLPSRSELPLNVSSKQKQPFAVQLSALIVWRPSTMKLKRKWQQLRQKSTWPVGYIKLHLEAAAASVPTIDLSSLLDGQEIRLGDGGMFGLDELDDVVTAEDKEEAQRRKDELQRQFTEAAKACFGDLKTKAAAIKEEQAKQKERLKAKRPRPSAEPAAAAADGNTSGPASGDANPPPQDKAPPTPGKAAASSAPPSAKPARAGAEPPEAAAGATPSVVKAAQEKLAQDAGWTVQLDHLVHCSFDHSEDAHSTLSFPSALGDYGHDGSVGADVYNFNVSNPGWSRVDVAACFLPLGSNFHRGRWGAAGGVRQDDLLFAAQLTDSQLECDERPEQPPAPRRRVRSSPAPALDRLIDQWAARWLRDPSFGQQDSDRLDFLDSCIIFLTDELSHPGFAWLLGARNQSPNQLAAEMCALSWQRNDHRRRRYLRWLASLSAAQRRMAMDTHNYEYNNGWGPKIYSYWSKFCEGELLDSDDSDVESDGIFSMSDPQSSDCAVRAGDAQWDPEHQDINSDHDSSVTDHNYSDDCHEWIGYDASAADHCQCHRRPDDAAARRTLASERVGGSGRLSWADWQANDADDRLDPHGRGRAGQQQRQLPHLLRTMASTWMTPEPDVHCEQEGRREWRDHCVSYVSAQLGADVFAPILE
ncbi:unnamed protein product, partial [Prorocentrum cordatum]